MRPATGTAPTPARIAVIGGGPGGLYAAALLKRLDPAREVTVWERNEPSDTFGFGVVLSDETLGGIRDADPAVYEALRRELVRWDDIDVVHRGHRTTSTGHGFAALGRRRLLELLHARCAELGVRLRFRTEAPPADELAATHDLVVAADGVHSRTREAHAAHFRPRITAHRCRYIWLAADFPFDAFRFEIAETEHGVMQLHAYPYSTGSSTVIVEMREEVWRAAGFHELDEAESTARCAKIFAEALGGRELRAHNSAWTAFRTVVNERWSYGNTVLIGDAAHTAHFSIGSGTKLAVEDALALATAVGEHPDLTEALTAYESGRRPVVESRPPASAGSRSSPTTSTARPAASPSTCSPAAAASPTPTCGCATRPSPKRSKPTSAAHPELRPCSRPSGSADSPCATGSSSRPWTCTSPRTAYPATSTSSTWAPGPSAAPDSS